MKKSRRQSSKAKAGEFIPGVYNYCDRWCERCALASRCLNFSLQQDRPAAGKAEKKKDPHDEDFWRRLEESLKNTAEIIEDLAIKRGLELDPAELKAIRWEKKTLSPDAADHALAVVAKHYAHEVNRWFEQQKQLLYDKEKEIKSGAELGVSGVYEEIASLTNVVEIIRWHQHLILVKLLRAIQGRLETHPDASAPNDADGSAKVALISMDQSIGAWMRLREHFPDHTDDILSLLVELDRLRRRVAAEFPQARSFVRPGFDAPLNVP
jgi:hypothetical protein